MKYDDLDVLGFWLFCMLALVCGTIIVIREVRKGPGRRRNRRVTLPPPSSACERKYDAGWWS